jgi:hypothetical protein
MVELLWWQFRYWNGKQGLVVRYLKIGWQVAAMSTQMDKSDGKRTVFYLLGRPSVLHQRFLVQLCLPTTIHRTKPTHSLTQFNQTRWINQYSYLLLPPERNGMDIVFLFHDIIYWFTFLFETSLPENGASWKIARIWMNTDHKFWFLVV